MGGLSESLVQEVGALTVEMDGALVVGQGLAITGIGGSQEAGQPIHRHWAQDGGDRGSRVQSLSEPGASVPPAGMAMEVAPPVPTVDLGDRGARVNLLDLLDKILRQLLLGWEMPVQRLAVRGHCSWGHTATQSPYQPHMPCT